MGGERSEEEDFTGKAAAWAELPALWSNKDVSKLSSTGLESGVTDRSLIFRCFIKL